MTQKMSVEEGSSVVMTDWIEERIITRAASAARPYAAKLPAIATPIKIPMNHRMTD